MTEHEKLKWICDTIGYTYYKYRWCWNYVVVDVREIIFTPEFRMLCMWYLQFTQNKVHFDSVMEHLEDPVTHLYSLLGLWNK